MAFGRLPDGRVLLASGSKDDTVRLYDLRADATGPAAPQIYVLAPSGPLAMVGEGAMLYVGCSDGIIALDLTRDIGTLQGVDVPDAASAR